MKFSCGFDCRLAWAALIGFLRGPRGAALAFGLLALGGGACDSNLTQPDPLHAVKCEPPATLLAGVHPQPFALGAIHAAFLHAAGPMASALGSSEQVSQLTQATREMAAQDGPTALDTACRLLIVASNALTAMADNPETLPDRDGIRLVLMLAAAAIQAGRP